MLAGGPFFATASIGVKALITGAAEGLGRALAKHLLSNGCEVLAIDRNATGLNELLIGWPNGCTAKHADLSDESFVNAKEALSLTSSIPTPFEEEFNKPTSSTTCEATFE